MLKHTKIGCMSVHIGYKKYQNNSIKIQVLCNTWLCYNTRSSYLRQHLNIKLEQISISLYRKMQLNTSQGKTLR